MPDNRVVVYQGPGKVSVEYIDHPKLELPDDVVGKLRLPEEAPHAAVSKTVSANICVLNDKAQTAEAVDAAVVPLDPHGMVMA